MPMPAYTDPNNGEEVKTVQAAFRYILYSATVVVIVIKMILGK